MFNGTVDFVANVKGNGLTFPRVEFDPNVASVSKVEIEATGGHRIQSTVHLANVATQDDGRRVAHRVIIDAINRISYHHGAAIENPRTTGDQFTPVNPAPGTVGTVAANLTLHLSGVAAVVLGVNPTQLKTRLEEASPPGEHNYELYSAALRSKSPVEQFMHLYNILLMLYGDRQANVEAFIRNHEPGVPETPDPRYPTSTPPRSKDGVKPTQLDPCIRRRESPPDLVHSLVAEVLPQGHETLQIRPRLDPPVQALPGQHR